MSVAAKKGGRSRRGLSESGARSVSPPLSPTTLQQTMSNLSTTSRMGDVTSDNNLPVILSYTKGEFLLGQSPEKDKATLQRSKNSAFTRTFPKMALQSGVASSTRGKRSPTKSKGKGSAASEVRKKSLCRFNIFCWLIELILFL